eukprot:31195-Pelagococcus_subviridis.AAC.12
MRRGEGRGAERQKKTKRKQTKKWGGRRTRSDLRAAPHALSSSVHEVIHRPHRVVVRVRALVLDVRVEAVGARESANEVGSERRIAAAAAGVGGGGVFRGHQRVAQREHAAAHDLHARHRVALRRRGADDVRERGVDALDAASAVVVSGSRDRARVCIFYSGPTGAPRARPLAFVRVPRAVVVLR